MNGTDLAQCTAAAAIDLASRDERICIVVNDSAETHGLSHAHEQLGRRMIDVGIAEQNLIGVASGLATQGYIPVVFSAACFMVPRALDQIRAACYARLNIKLCGMVAGLGYGPLGRSHFAIEDAALLRAMPSVEMFAPASCAEAGVVLSEAISTDGPTYIRVGSMVAVPEKLPPCVSIPMLPGVDSFQARTGDVIIASTGVTTLLALEAAELLLERGVRCGVYHFRRLFPIPTDALIAAVAPFRCVVSLEEHLDVGGLGSTLAEVLSEHGQTPVLRIGAPREFRGVGSRDDLTAALGFEPSALAHRVHDWVTGQASVARSGA